MAQVQILVLDSSCGLSFLLVLSFALRDISPVTLSSSLLKINISNSNSTRNQLDEEPLSGCVTSMSLLIIYYYYFIIFYLLLFIIYNLLFFFYFLFIIIYYLLLFLWDVSFKKRVLLNKFLVHVLSLFLLQ